MNAVAKERQALATVLDRCVADLESRQKEQLRRHRLHVEELLNKQLDLFSRREAPLREEEEEEDAEVAAEGIGQADRLLQPRSECHEEQPRSECHEEQALQPNGQEEQSASMHCQWTSMNDDNDNSTNKHRATEEDQKSTRFRTTRLKKSMSAVSENGPTSREPLGGHGFGHHAGSKDHLEKLRSCMSAAIGDGALPGITASTGTASGSSKRRHPSKAFSFFFHSDGWVHGTFFNLISALLIVSNAVFIGIQTHVQLQYSLSASADYVAVDWRPWEAAFLVCFIAELGARIINDRWLFLRGVEWRWNVFDSFIVGMSIIESVAESILSEVGVSFPFLRLVRVVRVLRVLKVLHMVPFFRRLGLMMTSVSASLSALAPAFVLLILLIYLFGICMMQGIIQYVDDNDTTNLQTQIEDRFGTVGTTMKTLFMSVTNGISWKECMEVIEVVGPLYDIAFLFYIGFVQICVLNIVTGVFVDTVHQMYRPEREEMVQREINKRKQVLNLIRSIFEDADEDGSGTITWEEFEDCIADEQISMYLSSLEIDITQAREIFEVLDSEGRNEVSIDEVVVGFLEMKGTAKGADLVILRNNVRKLMGRMSYFINDTARTLDAIRDAVEESRRDFWIVGGGLENMTFAGGAEAPAVAVGHQAHPPVGHQPPSTRGDESSVRGI